MKIKLFAIGMMVILTLSLVACLATNGGGKTDDEETVDPSSYAAATFVEFYTCTDFENNPNLNETIQMRTNKTLTIILCSNATTGFEWDDEAQISDPTVMEQQSHEYVAPASKEVGAAGTEKYTFQTLKSGTTTIYMEYSRPWEGGEKAVWTCTLNITVK